MATQLTLEHQGLIAADPQWQSRVTQSATNYAGIVVPESKGVSGTTQWKKRRDLADAILRHDGQKLATFYSITISSILVAVSSPDQSLISDTELHAAVTDSWNSVAGVREEDLVD